MQHMHPSGSIFLASKSIHNFFSVAVVIKRWDVEILLQEALVHWQLVSECSTLVRR